MREENLWEEILDAFAVEPGIDFAYPTQRITFDDDVHQGKREPGRVPETGKWVGWTTTGEKRKGG